MASGLTQMYLSIPCCNTMHCTRLLSRWIIAFSCLTLLFIMIIVVLCQQKSTEWILDHESELPPRVPFTLNSANRQYPGQIDRHPSLLNKEISCAENASCCILPTSRLPEFQVVFKMGASESMDQVYSNLNHTSKCISNVLVVSDKEQKVGRFHAHDVIADLPPWYRKHNKELEDYDKLNKPDTDASSISYANGHRLDKFKFLPMIEYAYKANPTAKWFIFLEADTFIAWNNVFQLLDQYNHSLPLYFGSPAPGRILPHGEKTWFAHGGTGYVLSSAAMDLLVSRTNSLHGQYLPRLSEQFQTLIKEDCCGDSVLGYALAWKGIPLTGLNPMFNPHSLHMLSFSTASWCVPIISIHKAQGQDIAGLSDFVAAKNKSIPVCSNSMNPPSLTHTLTASLKEKIISPLCRPLRIPSTFSYQIPWKLG